MSPIGDDIAGSVEVFLREIATIAWLRGAEIPSSGARVVAGMSEALDSDNRLWKRNTRALEEEARARISLTG